MTATQLIYRALRDIGCMRPGQSTSTDVLNDCLVELNDMIDLWLLDELMVFAYVANLYTLTGGVQQYTIGPSGAAFTAPRPTEIQDANIVLNTVNPVVRVPMELINVDQWAAIAVQQIPSAIPTKLYYDRNFSSTGYATLNIWPGPLDNYQLELFTRQQLQSFADLVTDYKFPPGYAVALRKNLAVKVAPAMKVYFKIAEPMLQEVARQAGEALTAIRSDNAPDPVLLCDSAFSGSARGGFNYFNGEVQGGRG